MSPERLEVMNKVLDGLLPSTEVTSEELSEMEFLMASKAFDFAIMEAYDRNPTMTFRGMENEYKN
jgi:hypothetical protein